MVVVTQCVQCGQKISEEMNEGWGAKYLCDSCQKNPTHLVNQSITGFNYNYLWKQSETQALNELRTFIVEK